MTSQSTAASAAGPGTLAVPVPLRPVFENIPEALRGLARWIVWKVKKAETGKKPDKVPFRASGARSTASSTDPTTWGRYEAAKARFEQGGFLGVGFVLNGDGLVGVDLDKCVNDGMPDPAAMAIMAQIGCQYVELSPSGTGLRGFGFSEVKSVAVGTINGISVELYADKRYLTVTGHVILPGPIAELPGFAQAVESIRGCRGGIEAVASNASIASDASIASVGDYPAGDYLIPGELIPKGQGLRNRMLFDLARRLRGAFPNLPCDDLRPIVEDWHQQALPAIGTKDFNVTWADFRVAFRKVKQPYGETLLRVIAALPELPGGTPGAEEFGGKGNWLLRICLALQQHEGDGPFFLSARQAGEQLEMHFTDAAALLAEFVALGAIHVVEKGRYGRAHRYRWGSDPALLKAAA